MAAGLLQAVRFITAVFRPRSPYIQSAARGTLLGIEASELMRRAWGLLLDVVPLAVGIVVLVVFVNELIEDLEDADWWLAVVDAAVAAGVVALIFQAGRRRRNGNAKA